MATKLNLWQERLRRDDEAWRKYADRFDHREALVRGERRVRPVVDEDRKNRAYHVRNICAELIEAQVDTAIPAPKVTARHKEDEPLAKIIEDMLIDEIHRLPMEEINDMMERTVPIQGGGFYLLEWDSAETTRTSVGEISAQCLHPKQIVPEDGVVSGIEDMDYIILKLPRTKEAIKKRYGVDLENEGEEEPEARSPLAESASACMVTQYVAYYRNEEGGIGKYSWVGDTELEDLEDYQARRVRRCKNCGAALPKTSFKAAGAADKKNEKDEKDGREEREDRKEAAAESAEAEREGENEALGGDRCPFCGGTAAETATEDYERVYTPRLSCHGVEIPGARPVERLDEEGNIVIDMEPTKIPYYKPDIYPVILQKSVSAFGQLMGDSDVDKIEDQQNSLNRLAAKMLDITIKSGSFATLPPDASIRTDNEDMKFIRLESAADKQMIDVFEMLPDYDEINGLYMLYSGFYEEARQAIGITDSFQGRRDTTATSGKAKEFAAQQSAGRLESKRAMKNAAYQRIYETIFKFKLAYADEPRPIIARDSKGGTVYEVFDRYDFLKKDENGEYYWNDQFIFDIDSAAPLARDRQALWQETRMNLQSGAFGDPMSLDTLILFWKKMDEYHYPGAADTKSYLMEQQQKQEQMMMARQMPPFGKEAYASGDPRSTERGGYLPYRPFGPIRGGSTPQGPSAPPPRERRQDGEN